MSRSTIAIRRAAAVVATAGAMLACGGRGTGAAPGPASERPTERLPLAELFILEMAGIPAEDTTVIFPAGRARTILLRHGEPDNTVFAELVFPASAFTGAGDSVRVSLHPRPGTYGLEVAMSAPAGPGSIIRFRYPMHFLAPRAARTRYGSTARLEAALVIGRVTDSTTCDLLPSVRPASDNLQAPLPRSGTYYVVARR